MQTQTPLAEILGIPENELPRALGRPDDADGIRNRAYDRVSYRIREGIDIDLLDGRCRRTTIRVAPRDISRKGIGVLRRGNSSCGTWVVVHLPTQAGETLCVPGKVVRCFSLAEDVYDVGIAFDEEIELERILARARHIEVGCT